MLDKLTSSDFTPHLHEVFHVQLEEGEPVELELLQVMDGDREHGPGGRTSFSLIFRGPLSRQYLVQHIHHLEHEKMGALDLFLVPIGFEEGCMQYEAIFN